MANEIQSRYASGVTLYAVVLDAGGNFWNSNTSSFEIVNPSNWQYYVVMTAEQNGSGVYLGSFPAAVPTGQYLLWFYLQTEGTPAATDAEAGERFVYWNGTTTLPVVPGLPDGAANPPVGDQTLTPNSATQPYLTVDQLWGFMDKDFAAQIFSTSPGVRATDDQLRASPALFAILSAASGQVEGHALAGKRYTAQALSSLTGVSRAYLNELVADLAVYKIYCRRDGQSPPKNVVDRYTEAHEKLKELSSGEEIFSFQETEEAGLPDDYFMQPGDIFNLNLISNRWTRTFGIRQNIERAW